MALVESDNRSIAQTILLLINNYELYQDERKLTKEKKGLALKNEKIPGLEPKKTYSETELIKYVSNYKKNSFDPLVFINKIDNAMI